VSALSLPPHVERALMASLAVMHTLRDEITALETILYQEAQLRPEFEILKTTPGIGHVLGATIMLETGTITRFAEVGHFRSYCRFVESKRISNGKKKSEGNSKNGNKHLARAFIEAQQLRCAAARKRDAFTNAGRPSACRLSR
jgi:transposase